MDLKLDQTPVTRTFYRYDGPNVRMERAATDQSEWGGDGNLAYAVMYGTGMLEGWLGAVVRPDETIQSTQARVTPGAAGLSNLTFSIRNEASGREETVTLNPFGASVTQSYSESDGPEVSVSASSYDSFGRVVRTDYTDGSYRTFEDYVAFGPRRIRDIDGSTITVGYNAEGLVRTVDDTGRKIFTATRVPSASTAPWTWASEAEASGASSNSAKSSSMGAPKAASTARRMSSIGTGGAASCRVDSSTIQLWGSRSARHDSS